jgi:hypothetical protein
MAASDQDFNREFSDLTPEQQAQVLGFMRALRGKPTGTPGRDLLRFAGLFPPEDIADIQKAIEEGCEQVDHGEW